MSDLLIDKLANCQIITTFAVLIRKIKNENRRLTKYSTYLRKSCVCI